MFPPFGFAEGRPFAKNAKDGTHRLGGEDEIKSLGTRPNEREEGFVQEWNCPTQTKGRLEWATPPNEKAQYHCLRKTSVSFTCWPVWSVPDVVSVISAPSADTTQRSFCVTWSSLL